jgi:hypothetical protein
MIPSIGERVLQLNRQLGTFTTLILVNCCTINVAKREESDEVASTVGGSGGQSAIAAFECPKWDTKSEEDIKAIVDESLSALTADGMIVDSSLIEDETRLARLVKDVYERANCSLDLSASSTGALTEEGVNYCGKGHGEPSLFLPTVSSCMTEACKDHDACYSMCSSPLLLLCYFSETSSACDKGFFAAIDACRSSKEYRFASTIVRYLAHFISDINPFTCDNVTCPEYGNLGNGPCGADALSASCESCIDAVDKGGLCRKEKCGVDPTDDLLYAATCDNVGQCYGGYGYGSPAVVNPDTGEVTDISPAPGAFWQLTLISGDIPKKKVNGDTWDVDESSMYQAPDAYVNLVVAAQVVTGSDIVQDTWSPNWESTIGEPMTTATVMGGVQMAVKDADMIFDDDIGVCSFPTDLTPFTGNELTLVCTPSDLALVVKLVAK